MQDSSPIVASTPVVRHTYGARHSEILAEQYNYSGIRKVGVAVMQKGSVHGCSWLQKKDWWLSFSPGIVRALDKLPENRLFPVVTAAQLMVNGSVGPQSVPFFSSDSLPSSVFLENTPEIVVHGHLFVIKRSVGLRMLEDGARVVELQACEGRHDNLPAGTFLGFLALSSPL
jgi:hypothetical protein